MTRPESGEQALLRAQYGAADTLLAAGATAAAPAAGTVVCSIAAPGAGRYKVRATGYQRGTIDVAHYANLQVRHGATVVGPILSTDLPTPAEDLIVDALAAENIDVQVIALGGAGSVFVATIAADLLD